MFCINCGQQMNDGTVFCPNCGQKQTETSSSAVSQAPQFAVPTPASTVPVMNAQPVTQPYSAYPTAKPKKKHGCLTAFIIVLAVIIIGAATVFFLLPGLARPADLGIKPTREAYASAMDKLDITKDAAPASGAADEYLTTYGALQNVEASLTSEELTSFFNENRPSYYAVKDVQVRVNDDGSIEASGKLNTSYVFNDMLGGQYTKEDAQSALPMLGLIPDNVNVYFKLDGSIEDNQVQGLNIESVKVMGIPVPEALINSAMPFINTTLDNYISTACHKSGAHVESLDVNDGQMNFKGSLPSSIDRIPKG